MQGLARIKNSYHLAVWITGEAAGFLDSLYPHDELELAVAKLIDREMARARAGTHHRSLHIQVHILEQLLEEKDAQIAQLQKEIDRLTATVNQRTEPVIALPPEVVPPSNLAPHNNPINRLQEICQQESVQMPSYRFSTCREGFSVKVQALGLEAMGVGRSKKDAKKDAAIALLEMFG